MSQPSDDAVRVFSMNCWGLKYIAKHRIARLHEISLRIARAAPSHDIIALQEFWVYADYLNLRNQTRSVLPYGKFYFSGALGGGLVILSKFPIESSSMYAYPLNGRPTAFWRGDWYVGKGIAHATLRHPTGRMIEVFNTHLHAPYEVNDTYLCHRTAQAWEIAKQLRGAVLRGSIVVAAGDFNMVPSSLAHRIITTHGLVSDSWLSLYPTTPAVSPPNSTAKSNIEQLGITCDSVLNTWRMPGPVLPSPESADPHAKRLDYVFHSPTSSHVLDATVGMTEPMSMPSQTGGKGGAGGYATLSDHFSVEVHLSLSPNPAQQSSLAAAKSPPKVPEAMLVDVAGEARAGEARMADQVGEVVHERYLPVSIVDEISVLIRTYTHRQEGEYFWRIAHFWGSLPILVGCHVAVWWSPHNGVAFALMFLAWVIAVTGTVDGLIGFLFMGSELRALKEFEEEMRMYRQLSIEDAGKVPSTTTGGTSGAGQFLL